MDFLNINRMRKELLKNEVSKLDKTDAGIFVEIVNLSDQINKLNYFQLRKEYKKIA